MAVRHLEAVCIATIERAKNLQKLVCEENESYLVTP